MDDYFDEFDGPQRTPMDDLINATISNGADLQHLAAEVGQLSAHQADLQNALITNSLMPQLQELHTANRWLKRMTWLLAAAVVLLAFK